MPLILQSEPRLGSLEGHGKGEGQAGATFCRGYINFQARDLGHVSMNNVRMSKQWGLAAGFLIALSRVFGS